MAPARRLNTTNPGGPNIRLNQSRKHNVFTSLKNKTVLSGKVKRNSQLLRKNNIALAKSLNISKQKISELTTLAMQYRERAHSAEHQLQQLQQRQQQYKHQLRRDFQAMTARYCDEQEMQTGSDSSRESVLQISLPARARSLGRTEGSFCHAGYKETRTQLVNPMVQGMSINKVKVRLERINDPREHLLQESVANPAASQRTSMQDVSVNNSESSPGEAIREESYSPVNEDITVHLTMDQVGGSREQFSHSLRVPSLTLQRLSLQDIQRTNSAPYITETVVEVSSANQSPQRGRSTFPSQRSPVSSSHEMGNRHSDTVCTPESPAKRGKQTPHSPVENPLEGTSWMYDTNQISRRIRVKNRRTLHHPISPKRDSTKRRFSVKNLAARESYRCQALKDFVPPTNDEAALQDMSLTLCLPMTAFNPCVLVEAVKAPPVEARDPLERVVSVADDHTTTEDGNVAKKLPTVAVTRMLDEEIFCLSVAGSNGSTSEEVWLSSPPPPAVSTQKSSSPIVSVDTVETSDGGDRSCDVPNAPITDEFREENCGVLSTSENQTSIDVVQISPGVQKKSPETAKVVLTRVNTSNETKDKPIPKRSRRRTYKTCESESGN